MKIELNPIYLPFQIKQHVFIHQSFYFLDENQFKTVPYFSGVIQSIELCLNPGSRLIRKDVPLTTLRIDMIKYEIQPHHQFNPFGLVQIIDRVETGSMLFASEQALLESKGKEVFAYRFYQKT